ncbi:DUF2922 family protein [Scopulibacillus darangshiensis]|uniref:DUF2922 family protein n=1 Tax=Scopulibacillus darangshiensis TaxID=442528 RepID=A0A4R2P6B6_9BACL|nr:DUF2922 domain-containing protein [Scopulibacillus darangshiensis]TCP29768.1 DUF2922 family protein [Scopulibacillus darangshiensis]
MKTIELIFENEEGGTVRISLDHPVEPYDPATVKAAIDAVLAEDVYTSAGGGLVKSKGARIIERNVTELTL